MVSIDVINDSFVSGDNVMDATEQTPASDDESAAEQSRNRLLDWIVFCALKINHSICNLYCKTFRHPNLVLQLAVQNIAYIGYLFRDSVGYRPMCPIW